MEPILPAPHNHENASTGERLVAPTPYINPETSPNTTMEGTHERKIPSAIPAPSVVSPDDIPSQPVIAVSTGQATSSPPATGLAGAPLVADDVDVIEKEWVDRAKKIVNATKNDPREQEKEVSKLQADYLLKRYNKQIKLTE